MLCTKLLTKYNVYTSSFCFLKSRFSDNVISNFQSTLKEKSLKNAKGSDECYAVRKKISKCDNAKEIIRIIKDNAHSNIDHTVFGAAIQRCGKLKDWSFALKIFELMNRCKIKASIIEYSILIDVLCKNDQILTALSILKQDNIECDLAIYNSLIIGCKHRCKVKLAEKLWKELRTKSLQPDLVTFNSMIAVYARSGLMDKAEALCKEMSDEKHSFLPDSVTYAAMMSGYAIMKNMQKLNAMQHAMEENGIALNEIHFSCFLKCFLLQNEPFAALDYFTYEIKRKLDKKRMNKLLIHQLCCAYLLIMENCMDSKHKINQFYKMITKTLPNEYGIYPSNGVLFDAMLIKYDGKWHCAVSHFEEAREKKEIHSFWKTGQFGEEWIDLHRHSHRTARFILYYVFMYQREYVQNEILAKNKDVIVLCGKGKHQEGQCMNMNNRNSMKDVVRTELLSWNPPIKCCEYDKESACLMLDADDVRSFLQTKKKEVK